MTQQEAIKVMLDNPYKKITHALFAPDEYIYSKGDRVIYDENGYASYGYGQYQIVGNNKYYFSIKFSSKLT